MDKVINLTHITVVGWVLIIILSGVAAAILNQVGAALIGKFQVRSQERLQKGEQAFKERMQQDDRENQSLQLLITAHFEQREKSLNNAVDVRDWIWRQLYKQYGPDYDYYGDNEPPANLTDVTDVISALHRISFCHPTRSVRYQAKKLRVSISSYFNSVNDEHDGLGDDPSEDRLNEWMKSADNLIELIHTPPSLDQVRRPGSDVDTMS